MSLTQHDDSATVTGTYSVTNLAGFSTGTVSTVAPSDVLSGPIMQVTWTDANGSQYVFNGLLDESRGYSGLASGTSGTTAFRVSVSH
jgi:hypothetical protein